ncbi:hypothetical protein [Streptomyces sp. NPDC091215]|uniref:hypothetical protein n=1 Tax=Streptomyces sp. NPDC091215 TaxID=3155192 RepID=UPI0034246AEE
MASAKQNSMRREIAGAIALLTDEHDFTAMRGYRTFPFDDYESYLSEVESVLRTCAAEGGHATVALFDPEEYVEFCSEMGLDPDALASRTRYTAEVATTSATLPYEGQPLAELVRDLIDEAVRMSTWEYAFTALARMGSCATCGEEIGRSAFARATEMLARIMDTAAPGKRNLVCSTSAAPETLVAVLHVDENSEGKTPLNERETLEFTAVLALGLARHGAGGLVMRTSTPGIADRVYGWRISEGGLWPLTAGEVFDAYCTDVQSGDIISPESDVDYCEPPDLGGVAHSDGHSH